MILKLYKAHTCFFIQILSRATSILMEVPLILSKFDNSDKIWTFRIIQGHKKVAISFDLISFLKRKLEGGFGSNFIRIKYDKIR